jgi:hypothetical protein
MPTGATGRLPWRAFNLRFYSRYRSFRHAHSVSKDGQDLAELLAPVGQQAESVETASWWEPPHPGYRDYTHQDESLIFRVRKSG